MTLMTIADAVGVSRTTVSNAYNRPDQLAPELRDRILGAARELGYAGPDPAARRLRSGRRDAVGLLVSSRTFTDPASLMLLQGIARATEDAGVGLLLVPERGGVRDAVVDALCLYSLPAEHPSVAAARECGVAARGRGRAADRRARVRRERRPARRTAGGRAPAGARAPPLRAARHVRDPPRPARRIPRGAGSGGRRVGGLRACGQLARAGARGRVAARSPPSRGRRR